jgi:hypothetical protein
VSEITLGEAEVKVLAVISGFVLSRNVSHPEIFEVYIAFIFW